MSIAENEEDTRPILCLWCLLPVEYCICPDSEEERPLTRIEKDLVEGLGEFLAQLEDV